MARYEHLPVFKATYDLTLYFFKLSQNFPKDIKYGLAVEIRGLLTELMDIIIIANSTTDKAPVLKKALLLLERLKFKARLVRDVRAMKVRSYEFFFRELSEISKQIKLWFDWAKSPTRVTS